MLALVVEGTWERVTTAALEEERTREGGMIRSMDGSDGVDLIIKYMYCL